MAYGALFGLLVARPASTQQRITTVVIPNQKTNTVMRSDMTEPGETLTLYSDRKETLHEDVSFKWSTEQPSAKKIFTVKWQPNSPHNN